ncbi:GPP34 family phosphoprotein [Actinomadura parmotrematis]|uniref:GPP34 family phosphoprotein n=1 Tax=Actinomadura parmotrematis TaxID=2864039 RepID=A0ABS7FN90_9ACTN|nr:GPP34 family phosphoprotein [Actinomadura parmotrematis]MBW8481781.1 GPP34 family phosphoprotein [Actinomadura parmotrematis]
MRIADEVLLLALHASGGRPPGGGPLGPALGAALLAELALAGRVKIVAGRVAVAAGDPTGDAELDAALARVAAAPERDAARWAAELGDGALRGRLAETLVEGGMVAAEEHWVDGVLASSGHPELNPRPRREVAARLAAARGGRPDDRTAALLAVAAAAGLVEPDGDGDGPYAWAAEAVAVAAAPGG